MLDELTFGESEGFQAHHHVSAHTTESHHLPRRAGMAYSVTPAFQPSEQLASLICPSRQCCTQYLVFVDKMLSLMRILRRCFEECPELVLAQCVRNGGIGFDT